MRPETPAFGSDDCDPLSRNLLARLAVVVAAISILTAIGSLPVGVQSVLAGDTSADPRPAAAISPQNQALRHREQRNQPDDHVAGPFQAHKRIHHSRQSLTMPYFSFARD